MTSFSQITFLFLISKVYNDKVAPNNTDEQSYEHLCRTTTMKNKNNLSSFTSKGRLPLCYSSHRACLTTLQTHWVSAGGDSRNCWES